MTSARILVLALALLLSAGVQATVYKCTDANGRVTYTNDRNLFRNCKPLSGDLPVSTVPSAPADAAQSAPPRATPAPTPNNFPRVTPDAQRARDEGRLEILEQELSAEQSALDAARARLKTEEERDAPEDRNVRRDGRSTINVEKRDERLQPFRNQVELHERNIEALQREMSRVR